MEDPLITTLTEWIELFMNRSMQNFILYSKEKGLSVSQLGAMFRIQRRGSSGVTDLGDFMGVTSAAASQMLERLVQQGLVSRSEDPHDRRVKVILLTVKGHRVLEESLLARQAWLTELVSLMSEDEKEKAATILKLLIEKANQIEKPIEVGV